MTISQYKDGVGLAIKNNLEMDYPGGASTEIISAVEAFLGLNFPESYRQMLYEYGTLEIEGGGNIRNYKKRFRWGRNSECYLGDRTISTEG